MNYIADTSVIIEKAVSRLVNEGKIEGRLLIPKSVLAELEHQANKKQETGFLGLEELQELQKLKSKGKIELDFIGLRPTNYQVQNAKLGEIDSIIVDLAYNEGAVLITADKVQAESAKAIGLEVNFLELKIPKLKLEIEKFFDETTMSVHLKEDCLPLAKKGFPGSWNLVKINDKKLTQKEIQQIAKDVVERSVIDEKTFVEISREGSTIVQHKNYRIVIVKPPVSDGWEITAVRPIKKLNLEDYKLSEEISTRIKKQARGIIVAGEVGSGKCLPKGTKVYLKNNNIKNIEDIKIGDKVLTYDDDCKVSYNKVIKLFKRKVDKTILIKTNFGKELELTTEHPIFSFKNGIPTWLEAKDLSISSRVATLRKIDNEGKIQKIDWINALERENVLIKLNEKINLEIPIEESLLGLKSKIVKAIKKKKHCKLRDIYKELGSKSGHIDVLLIELLKNDVIKRTNERHFIYSLIKENLKLKKGDMIQLSVLRKYLSAEDIYAITDSICKFGKYYKCSFINPPRYLNKELCELFGYYIGESLTKYGISTDSEFCRFRFIELSKKIFNIDVNKKRRIYDVYTDEYGTIELFLNKCFDISKFSSKKRATNHRMPGLVIKSPKVEIASFLRAYFDTESYLDKSKGIEVSSASIGLIKDVQLALLHFDIQSTMRTKIINNKEYYILMIYGYNNIKKFREEIGLVEKSDKLENYLKINKPGSPNKDTIPLRDLLYKIKENESFNIKHWVFQNDFSHERAQSIIKIISPHIKNKESLIALAAIEIISSDYIEWDKITSIKKINQEKEVYDIEVENTHNFIAGDVPFIVHNSTFAQGLAEYYAKNGKIVKTVESPRDLQLSDDITQYSKSFTSSEEIHDILFLSRPDNIIFDEIRDTPDFKLYIDLRLAGSNCLGVLHSASPIDAVQRFISRMETGMMPSVLDTIIFMENGALKQILTLKMTVKVPTGMAEADLARPVVEVRDFETNILEYEIYSYGEETVVIPIDKEIKTSPIKDLAIKKIEEEFSKYSSEMEVELVADNKAVIYVPYHEIAKIIGKQGKNIEQIEKEIGINIDIRELQGKTTSLKYNVEETSKYITFYIDKSNHPVDIFINDQFLFSATSSKKGEINIHRKSKLGNGVLSALHSKGKIEIRT